MATSLSLRSQVARVLLIGILLVLRQCVVDLFAQIGEDLIDVLSSLGRGLKVVDAKTPGQLLSLADLDSSAVIQVTFVAYQNLDDSFASVLLDFGKPVADMLKGGPICDVKDHYDTMGTLVIGLSDGLEPVLTGSVPNVQLDRLVIDADILDLEVHTDGGKECVVEYVVRES